MSQRVGTIPGFQSATITVEGVRLHYWLGGDPNGEPCIWQGMVHVFPANLALLRAAVEALDVIGEFLRGHVAP
jgi:hypothetical protein